MSRSVRRKENGVSGETVRVLMVGYNGANNTGSEALLLQDIEDVRAVFGQNVRITIPTLNEANLRRYVSESETLRIVPMPTLYFGTIRRLVKEHDLVMLVEGSSYMDTWGSPLLWAFLWATACAHALGKRTLAYAVDAGKLSKANRERVRKTASLTDLIITRNAAAAARLLDIGVTAPIEITADNAFLFDPDERESDRMAFMHMNGHTIGIPASGSDSGTCLREGTGTFTVGLAVVDFFLWPAVMRPWGRAEDCYKWPYFFSRSKERSRARDVLAQGYADLIDGLCSRHGFQVSLLCMEQVDEPLAREILSRLKNPDSVSLFSARELHAAKMTGLLRSLDLLVTSRFHASVLSLAAGVPQIAIGHDTRLSTLFGDLGLDEWFIDPKTEQFLRLPGETARELFSSVSERIRSLLREPGLQNGKLRRGCEDHMGRARRNRELLAAFACRYFQVPAMNGDGKRGGVWVA